MQSKELFVSLQSKLVCGLCTFPLIRMANSMLMRGPGNKSPDVKNATFQSLDFLFNSGVDPSHSLFQFVPQKNLTDKLARLLG